MTTLREATAVPAAEQAIYEPHWGQNMVHASNARIKVVDAGRRWGKGRAAVMELLRKFDEVTKEAVGPDVVPPFVGMVIAPTFGQASQPWDELRSYVPPGLVAKMLEDAKQIWLKPHNTRGISMYSESAKNKSIQTSGVIEVKSADNPASLQSRGADFIWITEKQDINEDAWARVEPTLNSPKRAGWLYVEGIPAINPDHWSERLFKEASDAESDAMRRFHFTSFDNPLLTPAQIKQINRAKEYMTEADWNRMYLAERSAIGGKTFPNIQACITDASNWMEGPDGNHRYILGYDPARKADTSPVVVMDACHRRVVAHAYLTNLAWEKQFEAVRQLYIRFRATKLYLDSTGLGDVVSRQLKLLNLNVNDLVLTKQTRDPLITNLRVAVDHATIQIPYDPRILRQFNAMRPLVMASGIKHEAPRGENDDYPFAVALALQGCIKAERAGDGAFDYPQPVRYAPSVSEMEKSIPISLGARMMRERKLDRMRERQEALPL